VAWNCHCIDDDDDDDGSMGPERTLQMSVDGCEAGCCSAITCILVSMGGRRVVITAKLKWKNVIEIKAAYL
jgi:hypothetical protein